MLLFWVNDDLKRSCWKVLALETDKVKLFNSYVQSGTTVFCVYRARQVCREYIQSSVLPNN